MTWWWHDDDILTMSWWPPSLATDRHQLMAWVRHQEASSLSLGPGLGCGSAHAQCSLRWSGPHGPVSAHSVCPQTLLLITLPPTKRNRLLTSCYHPPGCDMTGLRHCLLAWLSRPEAWLPPPDPGTSVNTEYRVSDAVSLSCELLWDDDNVCSLRNISFWEERTVLLGDQVLKFLFRLSPSICF